MDEKWKECSFVSPVFNGHLENNSFSRNADDVYPSIHPSTTAATTNTTSATFLTSLLQD